MDPRRGHPGAGAAELNPGDGSRRLRRGLLLVAVGALVALVTGGSDRGPDSRPPAPTAEAASSWESIALDFEGSVAPSVLLGGGGEDPELLAGLGRLGMTVEDFRAIGRGLMDEVTEAAAWRDREERRFLAALLARMPLPDGVDPKPDEDSGGTAPVQKEVFDVVRRLQNGLPAPRRELTP